MPSGHGHRTEGSAQKAGHCKASVLELRALTVWRSVGPDPIGEKAAEVSWDPRTSHTLRTLIRQLRCGVVRNAAARDSVGYGHLK